MKRTLPLICILLAMLVALSACTKTAITETYPRWANGEKLEYTIGLNEAVIGEETNAQGYARDYLLLSTTSDQIRPVAVTGKFVTETSLNQLKTECTVTTKQIVYEGYADSQIDKSTLLAFSDVVASSSNIGSICDDVSSYDFSSFDNLTVVKNVTETTVKFEYTQPQTPLYSSKKIVGVYVGSQNVEKTNIDVSATYDVKNGKVDVTSNGETKTVKIPTTKIIDANQITLYLRSLDKNSGSFADSPSVYAFDIVSCSQQTVNFRLVLENKLILRQNGADFTATVNLASVSVGGTVASMYVASLPSSLANNGLDVVTLDGKVVPALTPIRYMYGHYSYEIASYDDAIRTAITTIG